MISISVHDTNESIARIILNGNDAVDTWKPVILNICVGGIGT